MMRMRGDRRGGVFLTQWVGRGLWLLAWVVLVSVASRRVVGVEPSPVWRTDFKSALAEAEQKKLPLLVHFYADWCMPCQRMEREVLSSQSVKDVLGSRFVAVKLNSDHHQDIVNRYDVKTLPSDLVIDPINGKVITLHSEPFDKPRYLTMVAQAEAKFIKFHAVREQQTDPAGSGNGAAAEATKPADATTAVNATAGQVQQPELGEPQPVVGLDGYSPVALAKHRKWTRGVARHAWDYKDVTYYLASREELLEFRNDPAAFAPKLLGCDPVILWETDRAVAGDIQFGAFFDGELYLFKTDERRKQFKANPDKYVRLQHALKIDQVERTAMR